VTEERGDVAGDSETRAMLRQVISVLSHLSGGVMLRSTLLSLALCCTACSRDHGPSAPTVPDQANYTTVSDDDENVSGGRPRDDVVSATGVFTHVHAKYRECEGIDGHYFDGRNTFTGTVSGDPKLSGRLEWAVIQDLFNATKLNGPHSANVEIRDAASGRLKAKGVAQSWGDTPGDWLQGTIVGVVRDADDGKNMKLVANFRITFSNLTVQIGGVSSDPSQPAGVYKGGCTGKFTEFDQDFGSTAIANTTTAQAPAWRNRIFVR
jgi:hypothetical protein